MTQLSGYIKKIETGQKRKFKGTTKMTIWRKMTSVAVSTDEIRWRTRNCYLTLIHLALKTWNKETQ